MAIPEDKKSWSNSAGDKEFVMPFLRQQGRGMQLSDVSPELRADPEVVLTCCSDTPHALQFAAEALRGDPQFVLEVCRARESGGGGVAIRYASEAIRNDPAVAVVAIRESRNGEAFEHCGPAVLADKASVLAAVGGQQQGRNLMFASEDLRADLDVIAAAGSDGLQFAIISDRSVLLTMAAEGSLVSGNHVLQSMPDWAKADEEIVLAAVERNWVCLYDAAPALQATRSVVVAAIERGGGLRPDAGGVDGPWWGFEESGCALSMASPELRGDRELVRMAIQRTRCAFEHASDELRADRALLLEAIAVDNGKGRCEGSNSSVGLLAFAAPALRGDKEVVMAAAHRNGLELRDASEELRADKEVVLASVSECGFALEFASGPLRADKAVCDAAVATGDGARGFVHGLWGGRKSPADFIL